MLRRELLKLFALSPLAAAAKRTAPEDDDLRVWDGENWLYEDPCGFNLWEPGGPTVDLDGDVFAVAIFKEGGRDE